jgi:Xaa-Pro dipeptidase
VSTLEEMLGVIESIPGGDAPGPEPEASEFPIAEYGRRYARLQALMEESGLDAVLVSQRSNVRYYTGLRTWFWALPPVITILAILTRNPDDATIVDTATERGGIHQTTWMEEPNTYGPNDDPFDVVASALRSRGLESATLGLELGPGQLPRLSPSDLDRLKSCAPHARWVDASREISAVRALKSDHEVARIRESVRLTELAFQAVYEALSEGVTEIELTRIAARAMLDAGATPAMDAPILIFAAGAERYGQPLQPSTNRAIKGGELVLLDGGCTFEGYHSDFARCAVIGDLPHRAAELLDVTEHALDAAVSAIAPGIPLDRAFSAAGTVLDQAGLGAAAVNPHAIGHSIGLDHWEIPGVSGPGSVSGDVRARPGMVLCVEPQLAGADGDTDWRNGLFMLEDQVLVTEGGSEVLTNQIPRGVFSTS